MTNSFGRGHESLRRRTSISMRLHYRTLFGVEQISTRLENGSTEGEETGGNGLAKGNHVGIESPCPRNKERALAMTAETAHDFRHK